MLAVLVLGMRDIDRVGDQLPPFIDMGIARLAVLKIDIPLRGVEDRQQVFDAGFDLRALVGG